MSHIATARHKQGKSRSERETQRQKLVKESFLAYQKRLGKALAGTGLTEPEAVSSAESQQRIQIVRSMLQAGIPLAKVDYLLPLLESDRNERLTDSSHLSLYMPFLLEEEVKQLKEELTEARFSSVVFDGSTHLGEALVIVIRYVDSSWSFQQRLIRLHVLAKSLNGSQLARELITCLSTQYQIAPRHANSRNARWCCC